MKAIADAGGEHAEQAAEQADGELAADNNVAEPVGDDHACM